MAELTSDMLAEFVCRRFGGTTDYSGPDFPLLNAVPIGKLDRNTLSFCSKPTLPEPSDLAAVLCSYDLHNAPKISAMLLHVENPRLVFGKVVEHFFAPKTTVGLHRTAVIDETSVVGAGVAIGANSVIGPGCRIGAGSRIGSNVVLGAKVLVGEGCVILSGSVIGEAGFGVEFDADGHSFRLPHIGGVVLEDRVQVGSLCSIAAGTLEPTVLHEDVQLDNKVHIAHNVEIGARSLITACAEVSGSVQIGPDCWLGPNCSVMHKIQIGKNSFIGLGAVVTKHVADDVVVAGSPARVLRANSGVGR